MVLGAPRPFYAAGTKRPRGLHRGPCPCDWASMQYHCRLPSFVIVFVIVTKTAETQPDCRRPYSERPATSRIPTTQVKEGSPSVSTSALSMKNGPRCGWNGIFQDLGTRNAVWLRLICTVLFTAPLICRPSYHIISGTAERLKGWIAMLTSL